MKTTTDQRTTTCAEPGCDMDGFHQHIVECGACDGWHDANAHEPFAPAEYAIPAPPSCGACGCRAGEPSWHIEDCAHCQCSAKSLVEARP